MSRPRVYDAANEVIATVTALEIGDYTFDAAGRQERQGSMSNVTTNGYDVANEVIATVDPLAHRPASATTMPAGKPKSSTHCRTHT